MKPQNVENTIVDDFHGCTYIVNAARILTDGEMYSAIRCALLKRAGKHPGKGETLTITSSIGDDQGSKPKVRKKAIRPAAEEPAPVAVSEPVGLLG
jgi:hypothetical protein